jgi:hypothetical protein
MQNFASQTSALKTGPCETLKTLSTSNFRFCIVSARDKLFAVLRCEQEHTVNQGRSYISKTHKKKKTRKVRKQFRFILEPSAPILSREFKMPITNNGIWSTVESWFLHCCNWGRPQIYISPQHTFHRSDLVYSVKITFLYCKTQRCRLESIFYEEMMKIKRWNLPNTKPCRHNLS